MQNNLSKYALELKSKLDKNFFSPLFVRLAGLLYMNERYEECISVCKTGIVIYPNYLTAKIILLKAFLKAEYINEAEILFNDIKSKIHVKDMLQKLEQSLRNSKTISRQEKIYYKKYYKNKFDFKFFEKKFHVQGNLFTDYSLNNLFDSDIGILNISESELAEFKKKFESFHFENNFGKFSKNFLQEVNEQKSKDSETDILGKVRIITETLADIYSEQGNYKEAYEAYNILLRADLKNKKRIEEKLYELERNMLKNNSI